MNTLFAWKSRVRFVLHQNFNSEHGTNITVEAIFNTDA